MRMRTAVAHYWGGALAVLALGACAWALAETGRLLSQSANPWNAAETVRAVRSALAERAPAGEGYGGVSRPLDYSDRAAAALDCNGYGGAALAPVPPHLFHPVAPKPPRDRDRVAIVTPRLGPPVIHDVQAGHGRLEVLIGPNLEDERVTILSFELFRREEGGAYGGPLAVLEPGADGRASFRDGAVEPKRRYTYAARAIAAADVREVADERTLRRGPEGPKRRLKIVKPEGADEVRINDAPAWRTALSPEASAETPGDIELELMGTAGLPPIWSATVKIRQWNGGLEKWEEGTFNIEEGEPIIGERIVKRPTGQENVTFDSGHVLVRIERVMQAMVVATYTIEIEVPRIRVRETSTGVERFIVPGKWAAKAPAEGRDSESAAGPGPAEPAAD